MARVHLFEFNDMAWFPGFLRNYMTDFLQFLTNAANIYKPVTPILAQAVRQSGTQKIVDLASGGGGGILKLNRELLKEIPNLEITLTDFFPNLAAFEYTKSKAPNINFVAAPVDARHVPDGLDGLRTQFLSFHHFRPEDAKKILQDAVNSNAAIAVFETQERTFASLLAMLLSPVTLFLATPFIRPFRIGRIVFTYLIPVLPIAVLWDGVVSSLRTYSVKEMDALVAGLDNKDRFVWQTGRLRSGPGAVLYLTGNPKNL